MMYAMSLNQYFYKQVLCLVWAEMYMFKSKLIERSIRLLNTRKRDQIIHIMNVSIYIPTLNIINSAD